MWGITLTVNIFNPVKLTTVKKFKFFWVYMFFINPLMKSTKKSDLDRIFFNDTLDELVSFYSQQY